MIDAVSGPGNTAGASLGGALGSDDSMGRDEFLKLLVAQLKNQDPLKPQDGAQFVAELAQFSSVEQSMAINTRLDFLSTQMQGLANSQVVSLVGSTATVRGNIVSIDGAGATVPVQFSLTNDSETTIVSVHDQSGRVVRTLELGPRREGVVRVTWDGRDEAGNLQPAGAYSISVEAKTASGGAVAVNQETRGKVQSVSFDKGYPVLLLDNGISVPVSDLLRVDSPPTNPTNQ